jgi:very-short-patch-repair endonuclease
LSKTPSSFGEKKGCGSDKHLINFVFIFVGVKNPRYWYYPPLKEYAIQNRKTLTKAEAVLWQSINAKKLNGFKFQRQKPIDFYIVDFFCNEKALAIEVDGTSHFEADIYAKDVLKTTKIESLGIRLIRFTNEDVFERPVWVLEQIKSNLI